MSVPCSRFRPLHHARGLCAALGAFAFALPLLLDAASAQAQSATTFVKQYRADRGQWGRLIIGHSGASPDGRRGTAFTTGSNSGGYTLSEVVVRVGGSALTGASPRVSIYTTNSSGLPASSLHVLNNPASLTVNALNTFTAGSGATLAPNTTYAVVLQQTGTSGSLERPSYCHERRRGFGRGERMEHRRPTRLAQCGEHHHMEHNGERSRDD